MHKNSRIYVAGGAGLLGSTIVRQLIARGHKNIITSVRSCDLRDGKNAERMFANNKPEYVFLAAARVGNITANIRDPVGFLWDNIEIQNNMFQTAHNFGVKKLLFFASNCCYPKDCLQPMKEEYLMTGPLEPTNRAFAMAKLAGIEMCRSFNLQYGANFIVAIPASMYGENDRFDFERAHVIPAMIKKFHNAKMSELPEVVFDGDGSPRREFIYVDDAAAAAIFLMEHFNPTKEEIACGDIFINVGTGIDRTVAELADMVKSVVDYNGKIGWDTSKPNGMPRKLLDSSRFAAMGWQPKTDLYEGLRKTYQWFIKDIKMM